MRTSFVLTLLELQSRFEDQLPKFQVACPQNGTPALMHFLRRSASDIHLRMSHVCLKRMQDVLRRIRRVKTNLRRTKAPKSDQDAILIIHTTINSMCVPGMS